MIPKFRDAIVLITGATGGVGQALIPALQARGVAKIYAAGRNVSELSPTLGVVPLKMDVTSDADVQEAAAKASDVTILINNAGLNHNTSFLSAPSLKIAREELETNYLALLRIVREFAPALIANGGAVINVLAALARVNFPTMGSYCASKAAALSLTQGLRGELGPQGVHVVAALPGAIDTRMTAFLDIPKMMPADVAEELLDGFEQGQEEIYIGEMARSIASNLQVDPKSVEREVAGWV